METIVPDTNVVVRFLYSDHPAQSAKAQKLFSTSSVVLLETVFMETEWVLRAIYKLPRARIAQGLKALLRLESSVVERPALMEAVVLAYEKGFDFADALHYECGEGLEVKTFDRKFVNRGKKERWKVSLV